MRHYTFLLLLARFGLAFLTGGRAAAEEIPRLVITVANQFGFPVTNLKAEDFAVTVQGAARPVQSAQYKTHAVVDVVLMLETSEAGAPIRGPILEAAGAFIERLGEKEQMALVGYASSADMVQDFTSSKTLLRRAASGLRYGNRPALLDSLYAAIDGAFERAAGRRVLVVIGSGFDWRNRVEFKEVLHLARRNDVSVFALSFGGDGDLEKITEQTAGLFFRGRELKQMKQVAENLTAAFRGSYELIVPGVPLDGGKIKVEVRGGDRHRVGYRPSR